eukprot:17617-Heterococcus_DN1.PRE.1
MVGQYMQAIKQAVKARAILQQHQHQKTSEEGLLGGRGAGGAVTGLERTVIQLRNSAAVYI